MLTKYSEYEVRALKEEQSVVLEFEAWVHKKNKGIIHQDGKEGISVLTYADFSTDSVLHDKIPPELSA